MSTSTGISGTLSPSISLIFYLSFEPRFVSRDCTCNGYGNLLNVFPLINNCDVLMQTGHENNIIYIETFFAKFCLFLISLHNHYQTGKLSNRHLKDICERWIACDLWSGVCHSVTRCKIHVGCCRRLMIDCYNSYESFTNWSSL